MYIQILGILSRIKLKIIYKLEFKGRKKLINFNDINWTMNCKLDNTLKFNISDNIPNIEYSQQGIEKTIQLCTLGQ